MPALDPYNPEVEKPWGLEWKRGTRYWSVVSPWRVRLWSTRSGWKVSYGAHKAMGGTPEKALRDLFGAEPIQVWEVTYYPIGPLGAEQYREWVSRDSDGQGSLTWTPEGWRFPLSDRRYPTPEEAMEALQLTCWGGQWIPMGCYWVYSHFRLYRHDTGWRAQHIYLSKTGLGQTPEEAMERLLGPPLNLYGTRYYPQEDGDYYAGSGTVRWLNRLVLKREEGEPDQWYSDSGDGPWDTPERAYREVMALTQDYLEGEVAEVLGSLAMVRKLRQAVGAGQ